SGRTPARRRSPPRGSTRAIRSGITSRGSRTASRWPSPSAARERTSTGWSRRWRHAMPEPYVPPLFEPSPPPRPTAPLPPVAAPASAAAPAGGPPGPGPPGAPAVRRAGPHPPLPAPLTPQLRDRRRLLPARLVHDEAQPAHQRAGRRAARVPRPAPAAAAGGSAGHAPRALRPRRDAGRDRRPARDDAPAGGRRPRRADRPDARAGIPRRAGGGRTAPARAHPGLRARHEPGLGDARRIRRGAARAER